MPYTRLPETKSIYHLKQVPLTTDTGADHTSQGRKHLLKIQHTLGIQ